MTWTFILLLVLPTGEMKAEPTAVYGTQGACEIAREQARLKPLPTGVEGRLIGACREVRQT